MVVHRLSCFWLLLISLGILVVDQATKRAVEKYTEPGSLKVVIPGLLNLEHTRCLRMQALHG
jgi:lipoprotein signal peptidase